MSQRDLNKLSLLAEVACDYFERGLNQDEIARKLHLSRPRVSRLIKEAKESGIISFKINYNFERHYELEQRLKSRFHLKEVRVLNNRGRNPAVIQMDVANLAAKYVSERLKDDLIIGTSWGKTLADMVSQFQPFRFSVDVVQLVGSVPCKTPNTTPQAIVSDLASAIGGQAYFLNTPLFIDDDFVRETIQKDTNNSFILNKALYCDFAITGITDLSSIQNSEFWQAYMTSEMFEEIIAKGAAGAIFAKFYDIKGKLIDCAWNRKTVTASLENMKDVEDVIAVASSPGKAQAILSAVKGSFITTLITDGTTATKVLQLFEERH